MKTLFSIFVLIVSAATAFGQINPPTVPPQIPAISLETATEAAEAFKQFDFRQIKIDPNNLTRQAIADLRANFLPAVKPSIVAAGEYTKRLKRIAAPILLFHKAVKSETVVFTHQVPIIFTWKETFVTVSTAAIDLLTDDEIAALISHEIGHLYFAEQLGKRRAEGDDRAARIIELKCDLAALHTLSKLNIDSSNLIEAIEKLIKKRERSGGGVDNFQAGSPSLENRRRVYALYLESRKKVEKIASVLQN